MNEEQKSEEVNPPQPLDKKPANANGQEFAQQPTSRQQIGEAPGQPKSKTLYRIGWWVRLVGFVGWIVLLINPFTIIQLLQFDFLAIWYALIPTLLIAGGHYLLSRYKPENSFYNPLGVSPNQQAAKRWKGFFILLAALNIVTIIVPVSTIISVANSPASLAIVALIPVLLVGVLVLMVNVIAISRYLRRYRPEKKRMITGVIIIIVSAILLLFPGFLFVKNNLPFYVDPESRIEKIKEQAEQERVARDPDIPPKFENITKEKTIELLNNCKLEGFYYTKQNKSDNGGGGELSPTGVVLTYIDNEPYRVSIADRLVPELVPIARNAQKTCDGPQFYHDGGYEQRQSDGTWR